MAQKVAVKILHKKGHEDSYFAEKDSKRLKKLRQEIADKANKKYSEEHKYHCFRCGTESLAEVAEGKVKVDVCVNKNCGAIHLDPGELKEIIKDKKALSAAKDAFLSVFKR